MVVIAIWYQQGNYLVPTPHLHELRILAHLNEHPETPQAELARVVGLAPAMVNTYLRRLAEQGLITRSPKDGRGMEYRLTPEGERRRSFHVISFMAELNGLLQGVAGAVESRIRQACGETPTRLVLYGAGETGQMACLALRSLSHVTLLGVVDDDLAKVGQEFCGCVVRSPQALKDLKPDYVLVTSWLHADAIVARLAPQIEGTGIQALTLTT